MPEVINSMSAQVPCGAWPKQGAILFGSCVCHPRNNPGYTISAFHIILFIKLWFSLMVDPTLKNASKKSCKKILLSTISLYSSIITGLE